MFGSRVLLQRSTTMVRRQLTTNRGTPASLRSTMQPWIAEKRWSSSDAKPEPSAASTTENGGANNNTDASTPATPAAGNEEKITQLEKEIKELKDRVVRSLAEEENVRRIAKRDVDNARAYAVSGFAKSLLDVADILEMALLSVPKEGEAVALADAATALKTLTTGVAMTEKNLQKAFNQHGVVKYGAEVILLIICGYSCPTPNLNPNPSSITLLRTISSIPASISLVVLHLFHDAYLP